MNWTCIVAGKSGGHILPGVTIAQACKKQGDSILFITTNSPLDAAIMREYSFDKHMPINFAASHGFWGRVRFVFHLIKAFFKTFAILRRYKPYQVISMGGFISVPVCYAAYILRIPISIYELNAVPGRAVALVAPCAREIRACFANVQDTFFKNKNVLVPYPVRFSGDDIIKKDTACAYLGISHAARVIFVVGGSQGSRFINNLVKELIHSSDGVYVIHQTGIHDVDEMRAWYAAQSIPALVFSYRSDIHYCYSVADFIIARAGAGTLFEILFFNKRACIIPLETVANDHQVDNAYAMQHAYPNLFSVIRQRDTYTAIPMLKQMLLHGR